MINNNFQEEVVGLLKDAMAAKSGNTKGFVIDGFPVTMDQAKLFEDMIELQPRLWSLRLMMK